MKASYDVLVLGAGIVGAACALEFANAGLSVGVVERDAVGSGATAAAMGHIVVLDDSEAQFALSSYSQTLWHSLAGELPSEVGYYRPGTIWIAANEQEMAEVHRKQVYYAERGLAAEVMDSQTLAEAEPNLRRPLAGGLLVASDAVVNPRRAAEYLLAKAIKTGSVEFLTGCVAIHASNGRVVLQDGTQILSPKIINATGAWSPELTPGIAIRKRKGHLILTESYPDFARHQLVELGYLTSVQSSSAASVAFNVQPRMTGELLIGSSRQYDADETGVDEDVVSTMLARAALYMPALPTLTAARVWCGFRATTADKLPLIGPTQDPSIFLATGHEGLGITTSLATAKLLAAHILGRSSAIAIEPYLPSRSTNAANH